MTEVGLYSISVRGLDAPALLSWAAAEGIPFIHLRGGPRGYHLTDRPASVWRAWRRAADSTVPITGVTADTDLADLFADDPKIRDQAEEEVIRLAEAAAELGAAWLRLLSRTPPQAGWAGYELPTTAVPLLVEPHHPGWLAPGAFASLPAMGLLADTRQLAGTYPALAEAAERTGVLHLSDGGEGFGGSKAIADLVARRIAAGHPIEVAVEWTGADRSPQTCLARYRAATAWWAAEERP
ncbi:MULTISPECIES: AP endonuclease [Microbispora]|uniref:AP endonuclease n=1 Tax=Microbispora bryophytorum subsp. camponoti TaxID=1677852 RepID=A0ABR8L5W9_9ACTN|nr:MULTISPECIES: AP endonuclease [Microbispora]MBD3146332.1 AP endonuclease [Microbispora camponoti]